MGLVYLGTGIDGSACGFFVAFLEFSTGFLKSFCLLHWGRYEMLGLCYKSICSSYFPLGGCAIGPFYRCMYFSGVCVGFCVDLFLSFGSALSNGIDLFRNKCGRVRVNGFCFFFYFPGRPIGFRMDLLFLGSVQDVSIVPKKIGRISQICVSERCRVSHIT